MMSQLVTKRQWNKQNSLGLIYIKVKGEDIVEICMIKVIMIKEIIKIGIDQIAEIEEISLMVEFSMDKIEVYLGMNKITGMSL